MSQLVCPLCGRFVGIEHFDPRFFEHDIYAVEVRGLGRGRGFEVVGRYSVLDDLSITGLIADRCHRILIMIEGDGGLPAGEANALRATLEAWIKEARALEAELESQKRLVEEWKDEATRLHSESDDSDDEWDFAGEMQELLNRINSCANSEFDTLSDAIEFLLEG